MLCLHAGGCAARPQRRARRLSRCAAASSTPPALEALRFLSPDEALSVRSSFGTPVYVYDAATLKAQVPAQAALSSRAYAHASPARRKPRSPFLTLSDSR